MPDLMETGTGWKNLISIGKGPEIILFYFFTLFFFLYP